MDRLTVEFLPHELRIVGGDYGQFVLEGTTAAARHSIDQIVAATRRGDGRVEFGPFEFEYDNTPDLFEDRHAGREGTPQAGVGPDSTDDETGVEGGTGEWPAPRVE